MFQLFGLSIALINSLKSFSPKPSSSSISTFAEIRIGSIFSYSSKDSGLFFILESNISPLVLLSIPFSQDKVYSPPSSSSKKRAIDPPSEAIA